MSSKSRSAAAKGRGHSKPSSRTSPRHNTPSKSHQAVSNQEEQDEDDEPADTTPTKSAVRAPLSAQEATKAIATPTQASRELLAGLDLDATPSVQDQNPYQMEDAISKKTSELVASGWRPEEELTGMGHEEDDDDDDAYAGVDLISLSDEDDAAIRKQESRSFRQSSVPFGEQDAFARKLSMSDAGSEFLEWNGFDDFESTPGNGGAGLSRFLDFDETRPASFLLAEDDSSFPRESRVSSDNSRKVRFQDEMDRSDADSSDDEGSQTFPDIFMETAQFTPSFQRTNNDDMYLDDGSDAGSVWDFEGDEPHVQDDDDEEEEEEDDEWSESDGSSSGYDSDDGETTDEEEPSPVKRALKTDGDSSASPTVSEDATPKAAQTKIIATPVSRKTTQGKLRMTKTSPDSASRLPKAGTFDMDPRRNVLLVDGAGASQRNTLYPARIQTPEERKYWQKMRQAYENRTSTPRTSVQMSAADYSDDLDSTSSFFDPASPFDALGSLVPGTVLGPPEAFLPFTSVDASGMVTEDTSMASGSEDDDDDDMDLLTPFVNFSGDAEDDEDDSGDTSDFSDSLTRGRANTLPSTFVSAESMTPSPMTPSLTRHSTVGSSPFGGDLFSHLSRSKGLVNSFRMNQHYAKHMASYAVDPTVRYSTSEMNAMQTGRRKAANTPITPLRKKRGASFSKVGKVDWTKGLGMGKMGPPPRRPGSSGSGIGSGKKTPVRGHVFV